MLISTGEAKREDLPVGSTVDVAHRRRATATLTVQGIYASSELAQARVVDARLLVRHVGVSNPAGFVFLDARRRRRPTASSARRSTRRSTTYGIGELQDRDEFIDGRSDIIDQSLSFIYGLLALSVIIAIFGIVLTMLLAVYERRRETGLLRAVGHDAVAGADHRALGERAHVVVRRGRRRRARARARLRRDRRAARSRARQLHRAR